ncbi:VOC family protein [Rhodopseudomonas palustris]|uniref:Glyoxalase/bleomycin resistance protein/dioxygenase n=1 Tax=Rhodopseudomonas palustris (strain BisB18) TaxID=316056 RepID=Q20X52_RHOPB
MQVNPYLFYAGNCEEAFNYYARVLGGVIEAMLTHEGTPAAQHVPADWVKKIMHARLSIDGEVLMASDAPPGTAERPAGFSVSLNVEEPARAEQVFAALADGGVIKMPIAPTFWAKRFGMCIDRFGIPWMINCD